jgi:hypothetical protein
LIALTSKTSTKFMMQTGLGLVGSRCELEAGTFTQIADDGDHVLKMWAVVVPDVGPRV